MRVFDRIAKTIGAAVVLATFAIFGVSISEGPPQNAVVYIDHETKTYFAPDCPPPDMQQGAALAYFRQLRTQYGGERIWNEIASRSVRYKRTTYAASVNEHYAPDRLCRDKGAFDESSSLGVTLLRHFGLWPSRSRWNDDGSWNWESALW